MMQDGRRPPTGPNKRYLSPDDDPGDLCQDGGFYCIERVYKEPAMTALKAIDLKPITAKDIILVILENTQTVDQSDLYDSFKTDHAKIAIVYAFWLTCIPSGEEDKRKILQNIKDEVFVISGVASDNHAKKQFEELMNRDLHIHSMDLAPGPAPLSTLNTKLLETISRIVDHHLYIK
jgi:hypothetical protein